MKMLLITIHFKFQTPKAFSVNNTDDLKLALENIKGKCPNASVYGIGFSLGGLI